MVAGQVEPERCEKLTSRTCGVRLVISLLLPTSAKKAQINGDSTDGLPSVSVKRANEPFSLDLLINHATKYELLIGKVSRCRLVFVIKRVCDRSRRNQRSELHDHFVALDFKF